MTKLPPLGALWPFAAVAEHGSFAAAGKALGMTESALRYHVDQLERDLGRPLFLRDANSIAITEEGREFAVAVRDGFNILALASAHVTGAIERTVFRLAVPRLLAEEWLMPRLSGLAERAPWLDLAFGTDSLAGEATQNSQTVDLTDPASLFDAAVRLGDGKWARGPQDQGGDHGLACLPLFRETVQPVLSPRLMEHRHIDGPLDLLRFPLLQSAWRPHEWRNWFAAHGLPVPEEALAAKIVVLQDQAMVAAAAKTHRGVALLNKRFVRRGLLTGELLEPMSLAIDDGRLWYFVHAEERLGEPAVAMLRSWLEAECSAAL